MFGQLTAVVVALGALVALDPIAPAADDGPQGPAIGFVHDHAVLALDRGGKKESDLVTLFRNKLAPPGKDPPAVEQYAWGQLQMLTVPYRWHITHGVFWGTGATVEVFQHGMPRTPLEDCPFTREPFTKEQLAQLAKRYPGFTSGYGYRLFDWDLGPLADIYRRNRVGGGGLSQPELDLPMYFDSLPVGPTELLIPDYSFLGNGRSADDLESIGGVVTSVVGGRWSGPSSLRGTTRWNCPKTMRNRATVQTAAQAAPGDAHASPGVPPGLRGRCPTRLWEGCTGRVGAGWQVRETPKVSFPVDAVPAAMFAIVEESRHTTAPAAKRALPSTPWPSWPDCQPRR
jgi:hypothetical protein